MIFCEFPIDHGGRCCTIRLWEINPAKGIGREVQTKWSLIT
nr:MAG TPA: hypothetical protein [Caudoviricetes sp.]